MYSVYMDGFTMHDIRIKDTRLFEPKLSHEVNKAGSFTFTIYKTHPYISRINKMKSIIAICDESGIIWRGRILNSTGGFYDQMACICEGELAFFNDSCIRPYDYQGDLQGYFEFLIEQHNDQVDEERQFIVGNVTVTDPNDYLHFSSTQYPNTLDELNSKLVDKYGGYIWFRHEDDGVYIDYLEDSPYLCDQKIEFGKNLLDLSQVVKGQDVATVIIPRGAKIADNNGDTETEQRVSIESVNDDKDYVVNEEAAELFGRISKVIEWDDVTEPSNLLRKAQEYAADAGNLVTSITLTAIDLHHMDLNISSFRLFRYVQVISKFHELDNYYLIKKIDINLVNPTDGKLTVGTTFKTLVDKQVESSNKYSNIVERVEETENNLKINEGAVSDIRESIISLREEVGSDINQTAESIKASVYDNVYLKDEVNTLVSSVSTEMEQTSAGWQYTFNKFEQDLNDLAAGNDAAFDEIRKYIRFEDGNIILGNTESPLVLKLQNDRMSFLQNGYEVAYITDRKMYNTACEIIDRLIIGDSAWVVESNSAGDIVVSLIGI